MTNINQVVSEDKHLTTLKKSVTASGFDKILSTDGPFTVFAPTDLAFEKLKKNELNNLLKPGNKAKLTDMLNLHVVNGKVDFKDLKEGEKLKTVNGQELIVHVKDGKTTVQGAVVQHHDVQTSNGVLHAVDSVLHKN
jgi:uncharacterized surface protein with fasciclin (FAS1) repeats